MPIARDPACRPIRLAALVSFLVNEGWMPRTAGERIAFYRAGMPPLFNGSCFNVDPDMPSNWKHRPAYYESKLQRGEPPDG
jgi:hypothetical protein